MFDVWIFFVVFILVVYFDSLKKMVNKLLLLYEQFLPWEFNKKSAV